MLEAQGVPSANEAVQQRLRNLADACARWRTAIENYKLPEISSALAAGSGGHNGSGCPAFARGNGTRRRADAVHISGQGIAG